MQAPLRNNFQHQDAAASSSWPGSPKAWTHKSWVRWTWAAAVFISAVLSPYYQKAQAKSLAANNAAALPLSSTSKVPSLKEFVANLSANRNNANLPTGLYVPGVMALPIIQQPNGQLNYVSTREGELTQFQLASNYGTIGILAHNYLEGARFFEIQAGSELMLVYGDGHTQRYVVEQMLSYQALSPLSPYSDFVDLSAPDVKLSASDVFFRVYGQEGRLVLQTCIANGSSSSWGRLFVVALPADEPTWPGSFFNMKWMVVD